MVRKGISGTFNKRCCWNDDVPGRFLFLKRTIILAHLFGETMFLWNNLLLIFVFLFILEKSSVTFFFCFSVFLLNCWCFFFQLCSWFYIPQIHTTMPAAKMVADSTQSDSALERKKRRRDDKDYHKKNKRDGNRSRHSHSPVSPLDPLFSH